MKKLKGIGKSLTRQEMKSVNGGGPPGGGDCLYNSPNQCAPGCVYDADGVPIVPMAYQCIPTSGGGGHCTLVSCPILG